MTLSRQVPKMRVAASQSWQVASLWRTSLQHLCHFARLQRPLSLALSVGSA